MTVFPKWYVRGPLVSLSTIVFPGVYSVIVPLPSVVVVVVVVSETCAHANGATTAKAILNSIFFIVLFPFLSLSKANTSPRRFSRCWEVTALIHHGIGRGAWFGCHKNGLTISARCGLVAVVSSVLNP